MKSKLISIPRTNILYLPILDVNSLQATNKTFASTGAYYVTTNTSTSNKFAGLEGIVDGITPDQGQTAVRIDQGLDTPEISPLSALDADLVETQYIVQLDNRLGQLTDKNGSLTQPSFIDDDQIAHYYLSQGDGVYVNDIESVSADAPQQNMVIAGPRGTKVELKFKSSIELESSDYLFTKLGSTGTLVDKDGETQNIYFIDTIMRAMGATTGASIDVPIRFIKIQ